MDGKVATPVGSLAEIAARQHGVVSIAQLRRLGVSDDAVRARVLAGWLHRLHRGVYAVGHRGVSFEARCLAAVLAVGGGPAAQGKQVLGYWGAAIGYRSAAALWALLPAPGGDIEVSVQGAGGRLQRQGIRVHRSRSLRAADVTLRHGVPLTTPARTIADLRRVLSERELRRAIAARRGGGPLA